MSSLGLFTPSLAVIDGAPVRRGEKFAFDRDERSAEMIQAQALERIAAALEKFVAGAVARPGGGGG